VSKESYREHCREPGHRTAEQELRSTGAQLQMQCSSISQVVKRERKPRGTTQELRVNRPLALPVGNDSNIEASARDLLTQQPQLFAEAARLALTDQPQVFTKSGERRSSILEALLESQIEATGSAATAHAPTSSGLPTSAEPAVAESGHRQFAGKAVNLVGAYLGPRDLAAWERISHTHS